MSEVEWFRRYPNGGGTVYVKPSGLSNPCARITEEDVQPVVTVELPAFEEEQS